LLHAGLRPVAHAAREGLLQSRHFVGRERHLVVGRRDRLQLTLDDIGCQRAARNAARKTKNFAESDRIRDELAKMGVVLKDSKDGTTWEVAR